MGPSSDSTSARGCVGPPANPPGRPLRRTCRGLICAKDNCEMESRVHNADFNKPVSSAQFPLPFRCRPDRPNWINRLIDFGFWALLVGFTVGKTRFSLLAGKGLGA